MKRYLQKLLGTKTNQNANRVWPTVEGLEERALMTVTVIDGLLSVKGTVGAPLNSVFIREENTENMIHVFENGVEAHAPIPRSAVSRILSNSTKSFNYTIAGEMDLARTVTLGLNMPNSSATFDFSTATIKRDLTVGIHGAMGTQTVNMFFSKIDGAKVDVDSSLNRGDDRFTAEFAGDILGSANVMVDVIDSPDKVRDGRVILPGGADNYTVKTKLGVDVHLGEDAIFDVLLKGNDGRDTLTFGYTGEIDGDLSATLKGEGGIDTLNGGVGFGNGIFELLGRPGSSRRGTVVMIQDFNL